MSRTLFRALALPAAGSPPDEASRRLLQVAGAFESHFNHPPAGVARAPGRVNLIGEHVDYEGYAVLPMAIEQSVYVAFNVKKISSGSTGVMVLSVANTKPQYKAVTLSMDEQEQGIGGKREQEGAAWAKYVFCGVLGIRDARPELFAGEETELQMLVDGDIPAGCGLSSSSALVVASALATSSALMVPGQELLIREELAELCRQAEHRVGTMGGGMDQAVACLAQRGVALHLDFSSVPVTSNPVKVPDAAAGVTFVVANSLVIAEKAVDAATHFNKRVVECALAAKLIAKKAGIDNWRTMTRLVDVQKALGGSEGGMSFAELQKLASSSCPQKEFAISEIEAELGEPIAELFSGSSLEAGIKQVLVSAASFKLQQRALHVWGEAERVAQFQTICASLTKLTTSQAPVEMQLQSLGGVMSESHRSCKLLYECSCPELDTLVDAAMAAGALGARLTGAGWGGCIVALVRKNEVTSFMKSILSSYYNKRGISSGDASDATFESAPASGADIFISQ
ncbi:galactokinase [Phytophthora pseudosyringae]|uniref:Galactokinase n=1 Tax=Phytophthora pseudosyringae TaxID=221518 RepID=A0A8T1W2Q1_9STRA|nr:galactokinase [Phytophthora pseudosyringae]